MSSVDFRDVVAAALAAQPWYVRRKDTITAAAGLMLQVLNMGIFATGETPVWAAVLISSVIGLCQIVIHAGTKGAITPSMADRMEPFAVGRVEESVDYAYGQAMAAATAPLPAAPDAEAPPVSFDENGLPIYRFGGR